jgi:hypothetical protein
LIVRSIVYLAVILIAIIYGGFNWTRLKLPYKLLLALVSITFVEELLVRILKSIGESPFLVYHLYANAEMIMLSLVFYQIGLKSFKWGKSFLVFATSIFVFLSILNSIFVQLNKIPTNIIIIVSGVLFVFQSLSVYVYMLKMPEKKPLYLQSVFWFNTGCFVFYTVSFFVFSSIGFLQTKSSVRLLYNILYGMNIFLYLMYGIAMYMEVKANKLLMKRKVDLYGK